MSGVGARGVRTAKEGGVPEVTLVDFNRDAVKVSGKTAKLNRVAGRCEFVVSETSSYLHSRYGRGKKFDFVDVDPFGTPIRQIPAALQSVASGGLLSLTATDTAVLCGVYPKVSLRRYGAVPLNNHFHHETAVRILTDAVARQGASFDLGVFPVFAHATRHYVRVYCKVLEGVTDAEEALTHSGYVIWCPKCGHSSSSEVPDPRCGSCGSTAKVAGPLWTGGLCDEDLRGRAMKFAMDSGLPSAVKVLGSMERVDSFPPWSFSLEKVCSRLKVATVPEQRVRDELASKGFRTMRQPFETTGLKTDAGYSEVASAVSVCASSSAAARKPFY